MLNTERKEVFLEQVKDSGKYDSGAYDNIKRTLNVFSNFEDVIDKDICDWSISDIKESFISQNIISKASLDNHKSRLSAYTRWCINKELSNINYNNFDNINETVISKCINTSFAIGQFVTREELIEKLETLLNARDKFIILGLFEGIDVKELMDIEYTDADWDRNILKLNTGREFHISDKLAEYAKQSIVSDEYYVKSDYMTKKELKVYKKEDEDKHIVWNVKRADNEEGKMSITSLRRTIARIINQMGMPTLVPKWINKIGRYDYTRRKAEEVGIPVVKYDKSHIDEINKIYGKMSYAALGNYYDIVTELENKKIGR